MIACFKKEPKGGLLAEGKSRIPGRVAGFNINHLAGIGQFDAGAFCFPGAGNGATSKFEGIFSFR